VRVCFVHHCQGPEHCYAIVSVVEPADQARDAVTVGLKHFLERVQ